MASLKEATQDRRSTRASGKAPKSSANKFSTTPAVSTATPTASTSVIATAQSVGSSIAVPGLVTVTADHIAGMLPQFDHNAYQISDPINPPESLPQATETQFDQGMTRYEGAQRALKLVGAAFDTTRERFVVEGKKAKAFGAGIQMSTEFKKVEGNYLDYLTQSETTAQKSTGLDVARHKTTVDANTAVHTKEELSQKQELARIKAETAKAQVTDSQNKLNQFQKSLGLAAATK